MCAAVVTVFSNGHTVLVMHLLSKFFDHLFPMPWLYGAVVWRRRRTRYFVIMASPTAAHIPSSSHRLVLVVVVVAAAAAAAVAVVAVVWRRRHMRYFVITASPIAAHIRSSSHRLAPAHYYHHHPSKRSQPGKLWDPGRNRRMIKLTKIVSFSCMYPSSRWGRSCCVFGLSVFLCIPVRAYTRAQVEAFSDWLAVDF